MKYMGGKFRIRKYILPIILKDRKPDQWYVEPFCGGCNTLSEVQGNRIGNDSHYFLIKMWQAVSEGWLPPRNISEDVYKKLKNNPYIDPVLAGYAGFVLSWGAKWWGGYVKPEVQLKANRTPKNETAYLAAIKEFPKLKDVWFHNKDYKELKLPLTGSIIYCDPPYANTTKYGKEDFNHDEFWQWCRDKSKEGHQVFISEYNAPSDFECVWSINQIKNLQGNNQKNSIERLFKAP